MHKGECAVLSRAKSKLSVDRFDISHQAYECITPLRCLLLRHAADPRRYEALTQLQDHVADVKASEMNSIIQRNTVDFLREFMRYDGATPEEIYRMCGILLVNSFEVKHNGSRIRGLYPQTAMLAHDCTPNTKHAIDADLNMILRATVVIRKGTAITATYTNTFWNTMQRRRQLKFSKYFLCTCQRCSDPTELGTHLGTLLCGECGGQVLPTTPLDFDSPWTCGKCGDSILAKTVFWGDHILHKELKALDQTIAKPFEDFLDHYKKALHPGHRFMVEAKYALINIYGNSKEHRYRDMSQEELERKVKYCRELLTLAEVLAPGQSLLRGNLLIELQASLVAMARLLLSNDAISQDDSKEYMTEAVKKLQEATEILKHEPEMEKGGLDRKLQKLSEELDV